MMRKVVVFDMGMDGEMFAEYIERELAIIDVVRVLGQIHRTPNLTAEETCIMIEASLLPYIHKAEVIIIASYEATLIALDFLSRKYPEQKFIGFKPKLSHFLSKVPDGKCVLTLASKEVRESLEYESEINRLKRFQTIELDYDEWKSELAQSNCPTSSRIPPKTVDIVLMYNNKFRNMRQVFENIYGWQVRVLDNYGIVFRETCSALGLRGIDGGRGNFKL